MRKLFPFCVSLILVVVATGVASAQSFRVQCPTSTITHPVAANNNSEPAYTGPTTFTTGPTGYQVPSNVNGAIKCQQISGGDGFATMGDGTQTYMFSFGPLSGLADIANGKPGTEYPKDFNVVYPGNLAPGDPAATDWSPTAPATPADWPAFPLPTSNFTYNGAVGLAPDVANLVTIYDIAQDSTTNVAIVQLNAPLGLNPGDQVIISGTGTGYDNCPTAPAVPCTTGSAAGNPATWTITGIGFPAPVPTIGSANAGGVINYGFTSNFVFTFNPTATGLPDVNTSQTAVASTPSVINGHVDPRPIMDVGVMNGNIPAPLMAIDEDDEFFLTLTNVGMIMRPDLFEQHTVHFHGYPNASAFYDGVPDASVAINIGASFTYYYLAPDAGTYFWHCHITPPEHLQMGMVGQLYVRPRQNRVAAGSSLYDALVAQRGDLRTKCDSAADILCSNPLPAAGTAGSAPRAATGNYAYNDGDGSTYYDVEYPLQIHGFDPNFHFVGMTFNPEGFADMKDKYFLLNGRSYPDTVTPGPLATQTTDGAMHFSQPLPSIISMTAGQKALLRISDLDVSEYQTLASLGIPMKVIALNAKLLRDQAGNNLYYNTNSITLAGGESLDVILDSTGVPVGTYYLYTPNLDHLSNDAENFGGLMTEVHICNSITNGTCN